VIAPVVRLVLWNLADSLTTIEELRAYLRDESVAAFEQVPGLLFKAWIADEATERWGAIYVWESREAAEAPVASRARELIGKDPEVGETFDVEATVSVAAELARRGIALET
jgi:Putative mono-oxygenase ydhR